MDLKKEEGWMTGVRTCGASGDVPPSSPCKAEEGSPLDANGRRLVFFRDREPQSHSRLIHAVWVLSSPKPSGFLWKDRPWG